MERVVQFTAPRQVEVAGRVPAAVHRGTGPYRTRTWDLAGGDGGHRGEGVVPARCPLPGDPVEAVRAAPGLLKRSGR
ncbi:hypothetical protein GCM10023220_66540 [Streptomyces ziwulingensis]|uniref:Uncharacterized protein n=1 Tax=Streptomyces ziwulingensis TaxID=1045501 RepID=A0ABP9D514_9ACTN